MKHPANWSHQYNLFDPKLAKPVVLFGAGSVGSWAALFLAKMGIVEIEVWDSDTVASHNTPMSLYGPSDIGRYKVEVLRERVHELSGVTVSIRKEMYQGTVLPRNVLVISCVDTMSARKKIWGRVKHNPSISLFCDTRLNGAYVEVLSIEPNTKTDIKRYDGLLFEDKAATRQTCGMHGIVFASTRAAGIVTATIATFLTERTKEWYVRERCDTLISV